MIDTNNYYPQRDGHIPELDTIDDLIRAAAGALPTSKVVKAFNHIQAAQLTIDGQPAGWPSSRAVIAGDDPDAKTIVKA